MKFSRFVLAMMIVVLATGAVGLSAAELYQTEKWPQTRVLVWSKPGTSGSIGARSWTEYASKADYLAKKGGRPTRRGPDKNTDIILPDAPDAKPYVVLYSVVAYRRSGGLDHPQWACRHLTIGKGARLDSGAKSSRGGVTFNRGFRGETAMAIYGNVTIKDGGYFYGPRFFLGDKHTFFTIGKSSNALDQSWIIRKTKNASLSLLGKRYDVARGVAVESGRLVVHSQSQLYFGVGYEARITAGKIRKAKIPQTSGYVFVGKNAALELRSGSRIGRLVEPENLVADLQIEGLLQIGRKGDKNRSPAVIELTMAEGDGGFLRQYGGLYICRTAEVKNYGKLAITSTKPDAKATAGKGVSVFLEKAVDLGNVSFDYLRPGGISAIDVNTAKAAGDKATFGEHCGARGDKLFSKYASIEFQGGMGTVEFVDGLKTDCKILFPHAGRLMVRSKGNRTLQSFDLKSVHAVTIKGKRTKFNAKRSLNDKEKELREINPLWGDVPGKGQYGKYGKQKWSDCPVMIWARPGVSGLRFTGSNWLDETGRPYFDCPLISQRNPRSDNPPIDMLMPASDTGYIASGWGDGGNEGTPPSRHLTVEYNASYGITYNVQGNLWMKHGSGLVGKHRGRYVNEQPNIHRFMRFDGKRKGRGEKLAESQDASLAQWGDFGAGKGSTLEMIGKIRCAADRAYVRGHGTLIISEGAVLADGYRAAFYIGPNSTVALLEDAILGHETSMQRAGCASIACNGTLMIGMPDRPIGRDSVFGIAGMTKNQINRTLGGGGRSPGASLILTAKSRFVVHSVDPKKARVIIKMHGSERAKKTLNRGTPEGIVCYFGGKAELNGVVFDNVLEGGIMVSPETRKTWKNISYGKNNQAEPEKLYWDLKVKDKK
ncbi:MAG: hypothetical protein GY794_03230 [bacterium]|nr:hypothetical protein [bacterium]